MANRTKLQCSRHRSNIQWNPEKILSEALAEKAEFLQKHPHHFKFQKEIDRLLDKAGNSENRMTTLAILMEGKLIELHHQLQKLNKLLLKSRIAPDFKRHMATHPNLYRISNN